MGPRPSLQRLAGALLLVVGLGLGAAVQAQDVLEGEVIAVHDGDTISVRVGDETVKVRLAGIDTPERGQPWADRARRALAASVFRKQVRINAVAIDRFGRTVGEVYANNVCVGCELVREGHAWVYRKYSDDPVLLRLEAEAREGRRGLWGLSEAERVPPWDWRHGGARTARDAAAAPDASEAFVCAGKSSCREMRSCAEAEFYLRQCGSERIDGDGDGVPCEALCR